MRKIVAGLFISLDGVVEEPGDWHFPYFNDEMGAAVTATLGAADIVLFGRRTYDSFAGAWPEREAAGEEDAEMAKALGDVRKIVVSNQPLEFTWRNSEQLEGDLVETVTALKNEPGEGTIGLSGSVSVVRQLLAAGLLDELHLLVHPIAVRKGMRLFDEGETPDPADAALVRDLQDGGAEPRLRARRVDRRRHLRGRQGPPVPARAVSDGGAWSSVRRGCTMQIPWLEIGLVLLLVVINAAFAGSEVALISLREGQLRRLEQEGEQGRLVARLARDPNQFLSTIQIGITLAGFLASAAAAVSLAQPLVPLLEGLGRAAEPVAVLLVTMVLTYLTLVVGELAPKRIALQRPERWARRAARPLAVVSTLTRPAVWLLSKSTDVLVRLAGADPGRQREEVTEEEVRDMIATGAVFRPEQRRILAETIELGERRLSDVLVPRRDVVAIPAEATVQEAIQTLLQSTHGRAPVYRGDLDNVLGLVTLQDLVGAEGLVADCVRPILALPESMGVLEALRRLQAARGQLAIVVDEYGGTAGIITVEDLLEELVGEIYDEFDPDFRGVQHRPDGSMVLPGSFPVHDLSDLGVSLPEGSYATVAGLILERLGRIPSEGDAVEVDRWRLEVLAMDRNAIGRVRLVPLGDDSRPS